MVTVQSSPIDIGSSPRSTVLGGSGHMTTDLSSMNESNMATGIANGDVKVTTPPSGEVVNPAESDAANPGKEERESPSKETKPEGREGGTPDETQVPVPTYQGVPAAGYYLAYPHHSDTPPSPSTPGHLVTQLPYENSIGFIHQPGQFSAAHTSPFGVPNPNTPVSPPRPTANMVGVPPASPLFPRINSGGLEGGVGVIPPPSPSLPYMTGALGSYAGVVRTQTEGSSDDASWDARNHNHYPSPQVGASMPYIIPRTGQRTYSFDGQESMLPPAMMEQVNPAYSPYSAGHNSPAGAAVYTQQPWNYPGPPDMYSVPGSPLQPRPTAHPQMFAANMGGGMRPMGGPYGQPQQLYPSSSPGPPIQTTASNKGPDGANLFIFHIPNQFTNLDMYNLFCHYGNLLSVRIMVEKETGRSRGFGFVSYDNPESAAQAIKELNGYTIGNKRLKVQHKQIRPRDLHDRDGHPQGGSFDDGGGGNFGRPYPSSLPPSGQQTENMWYDQQADQTAPTTAVATAVANSTEISPEEGEVANKTGDENPQSSPLSNLGPLQSALPEVSGDAPAE